MRIPDQGRAKDAILADLRAKSAGDTKWREGRVFSLVYHAGDAHEDLGWVTNPLRAGEHRIIGAWEPDDLFERWSARTGMAVDRDAVRWWQVLANVKLSVIVLTGVRAVVEGRLHRIHQTPVRIYQLLLEQIGA